MWRPGTAVTIASTNVAQQLTDDESLLVKAVRIMTDPSAANIIYVGDSTLDPAASPKEGVIAWIDNPDASAPGENYIELKENDAPNGIKPALLFLGGTAGQVILWAYLEQ